MVDDSYYVWNFADQGNDPAGSGTVDSDLIPDQAEQDNSILDANSITGQEAGSITELDLGPDSYLNWTFYAYSGDSYSGFAVDDSSAWYAGQTWSTSDGYYYISSEAEYGYNTQWENQVYTTSYYDAGTGSTFSTYSGGGYATGTNGLGSEYDYAWNGSNYDDFGYGGYYQANSDADSYLTWTFYAYSGDSYSGFAVDDSSAWYAGQTWSTNDGYYYISSEAEYGYNTQWDNQVYTTSYYDAGTGSTLSTYSGGGYATGTNGLGSEYDYAWNGINYDDFGYGGYYQANRVA